MMDQNRKKKLLLQLPYVLVGLLGTNLGQAWRLAQGENFSQRLLDWFGSVGPVWENLWPSLHPTDLLVGAVCGVALRLVVYLQGEETKKYRHGVEYGSARCGPLPQGFGAVQPDDHQTVREVRVL